MSEVVVRDVEAADLPRLLEINQAAVPGVNALGAVDLARLVDMAFVVLVAAGEDGPAGFVVCLAEGCDYDSANYAWISQRYDRFAYVDRVAIAPERRSDGVGGEFYRELLARLDGRRDRLLAEVNLAPPNPGSLRFHERHGFHRVGERWHEGGAKGVVYLERALGG